MPSPHRHGIGTGLEPGLEPGLWGVHTWLLFRCTVLRRLAWRWSEAIRCEFSGQVKATGYRRGEMYVECGERSKCWGEV